MGWDPEGRLQLLAERGVWVSEEQIEKTKIEMEEKVQKQTRDCIRDFADGVWHPLVDPAVALMLHRGRQEDRGHRYVLLRRRLLALAKPLRDLIAAHAL